MKIGVDLDDVLLGLNEALCAFHNREYGTSYKPEEVTEFLIHGLWDCSPEEAIERVFLFYQSPEHLNAKPVRGSVEAISKLKEKHSLHLVTAKPESVRQITTDWLDKYFPKMFDGIHFTNQFHGNDKKLKSEVCQELRIELFIDDALHNAEDITSVGVPVLLLDQPWNRKPIDNNLVTRVKSWEEILKKLQ